MGLKLFRRKKYIYGILLSHICTCHYSVHKSYYQYFLLGYNKYSLCCIIIKGIYSSSRNRQIFVQCTWILYRVKHEQSKIAWIALWLITLTHKYTHTLSFYSKFNNWNGRAKVRKNHRYQIWETWLSHGGMYIKEEMRVKKRECGWIHLSLTYLTFACIILMILALISLRHPPLCLKLCVIKGMRTTELCITNRISQNVFRSDQTLRKNEKRGLWMRYCFDTFLRTKTPRKMLPRSFWKAE